MLSKFNKLIIDCLNNINKDDFINIYGYSWLFNFFLFLLINSFLGGVHFD